MRSNRDRLGVPWHLPGEVESTCRDTGMDDLVSTPERENSLAKGPMVSPGRERSVTKHSGGRLGDSHRKERSDSWAR